MSFKPPHELDDGTGNVTRLSLVPISDGTSVQKCTTQQLISASLGTSSSIEYNSLDQLSIKDNAVTASKILNNSITPEKIQDGAIGLDKLKSTGENSIPITSLIRKTVCVHVGNYYYKGAKKVASDLLNFATISSAEFYEPRTEVGVDWWEHDSLMGAWGGTHGDSTEAQIIEPFATISAAARYILYNHGPNANALFLIHGHVCAFGEYDLDINKRIAEVGPWSSFKKVAFVSGSNPMMDTPEAYFTHYFTDRTTLARIDWDHDAKSGAASGEKKRGWFFRGPDVSMSGVNNVFSSSSNFPELSNRFVGGTHNMNGVRMASYGDIDYFTPYLIENNAQIFFGESLLPDAGNEFYFKESGILFNVSDNSKLYYSHDSSGNNLFIESYASNADIKFVHLSNRATLQIGNVDVKIKGSIKTDVESIIMRHGRNTLITKIAGPHYLLGNGGFDDTGSDYDAYYAEAGAISDNSNRKNYTDIKLETSSLYNRNAGSSYTPPANVAVDGDRLSFGSSFKNAPSTRVNNPYSDQ